MSTAAARVVTTAFGVSGATNNVKMTQFIQEVVAPRIFERTKRQTTFAPLVNREYEGVIKGKGDQVRIFDVGPIYATRYADGGAPVTAGADFTAGGAIKLPANRGGSLGSRGTIKYQTLVGNAMVVTITEGDYYGFEVEDVEQFISNPSYVQKAIGNAATALSQASDRWIYSQMLSSASNSTANEFGFKGGTSALTSGVVIMDASLHSASTASAIAAAADKVYYRLVDLGALMDDALVPEEGRWIVVPSFAKAAFLKSSLFVAAGADGQGAARDKGTLGSIAGFKVITMGRDTWSDYSPTDASGNLYKWATASASGNVAYANGEVMANSARDPYKAVPAGMTVVDHSGNLNTYYGVAGHNDAYTYIDALTKNEQIRLEGSFADAWRGLHVYGGKAIRPNYLFKTTFVDDAHSKYAAE